MFKIYFFRMASAAVSLPSGRNSSVHVQKPFPVTSSEKPHNVQTILNYYKDPGDGSPPPPTYAGRPETYNNKPVEPTPVTVTDISGHELDYTLDGNGFQIYYHESKEKDFLDDEKIKREYYPETEQLLKDA